MGLVCAGVGRAALVASVPVRAIPVTGHSLPAPGVQEVGREEVRATPQRAKDICKRRTGLTERLLLKTG